MKITEIQFFGSEDEYSANIAIDDLWVLQYDRDGEYTIPQSNETFWLEEAPQDFAADEYDAGDVAVAVSAGNAMREAMQDEANWITRYPSRRDELDDMLEGIED